MLADEVKQRIRDALESVGRELPGFRPRFAQRKMIAEVAKVLSGDYDEDRRLLCVEGPTGTGKTMAYLLAAIPVAAAQGRHLVIASATVALQEQLIHRDLPDLARWSGLGFDFVLAKGRGRYACRRNLGRLTGNESGQAVLFTGQEEASWDRPPQASELSLLTELEAAWNRDEWDGDLDAWRSELGDDLRRRLAADRHSCNGRRCRLYNQCAFYRAREGMMHADVIVANHDLVLADLAMGGGVVLPPPQETIYVFDEAHHLAGKALSHFSAAASLRGVANWLKNAARTAKAAEALIDPASNAEGDSIEADANAAAGHLERLAGQLADSDWFSADNPLYRFTRGEVPPAMGDAGREIHAHAAALRKRLEKLGDKLNKGQDNGLVSDENAESIAPAMGQLQQRLENLEHLWEMMTRVVSEGEAPLSRWVERVDGAAGDTDYLVCASMIDVSDLYRESLWSNCGGAVLTSATLTSLGSFERLRGQLGLGDDDGTQYLRLESPFDYAANGVLSVPRMASDPRDRDAHTDEVVELLPGILGEEPGCLVLFSSRWQMRRVAEDLPPAWSNRLLMQGELPKQVLLERHRQAVEDGRQSIIFGLASFAEGIDLPGALCSHVVIAKLPFAVPTSPIEQSTAEWLEGQGRNPFMEIAVPDAALRLLQACGRLLRSEEDRGTVTILDRRLVTKRYGRDLMQALPPFTRRIEP